jgi:hypothetical protein
MPPYDPIHIPTFVAKKYIDEIRTIKKYLAVAFPNSTVDIAYSIDLFAMGFRVSDINGNNVVYFNSIFLEYLNAPLKDWLSSSGIKEYFSMHADSTILIDKAGELKSLRGTQQ